MRKLQSRIKDLKASIDAVSSLHWDAEQVGTEENLIAIRTLALPDILDIGKDVRRLLGTQERREAQLLSAELTTAEITSYVRQHALPIVFSKRGSGQTALSIDRGETEKNNELNSMFVQIFDRSEAEVIRRGDLREDDAKTREKFRKRTQEQVMIHCLPVLVKDPSEHDSKLVVKNTTVGEPIAVIIGKEFHEIGGTLTKKARDAGISPDELMSASLADARKEVAGLQHVFTGYYLLYVLIEHELQAD